MSGDEVSLEISAATGPRLFSTVETRPEAPPVMSEEILDYYGWVFCQGGFANLDVTFGQFLAVAAKLGAQGLISYEFTDMAHNRVDPSQVLERRSLSYTSFDRTDDL